MDVTITLESVCSGGGHATLGVTIDGGQKAILHVETDQIRAAIEDREALVLGMTKLALTGLTRAQARTKLQAGISITL